MWARSSRGEGEIPLRTPTNPAWRYNIFFFIFFFCSQSGDRDSDAESSEGFSQSQIARLLGCVLWESRFPTIVSSLVARSWLSFVWMCVCGVQTLLLPESAAAGRETGLRSSGASPAEASSCSTPAPGAFFCSVAVLPSWLFFCFFYFFVNRGASRCGRASGVSGSSEQQDCMSWAVCSPSQRTGEMLLKGQ